MMARGAKPLTLIGTDEFGTLLTQWNVVSGPDTVGDLRSMGGDPSRTMGCLKLIEQL
jgi:hypothetical protein